MRRRRSVRPTKRPGGSGKSRTGMSLGKAPSAKEMGQECPVCTGAAEVTDEEYAEWKREMEESVELPFQ